MSGLLTCIKLGVFFLRGTVGGIEGYGINGRGGFCYELGGVFRVLALLVWLGV